MIRRAEARGTMVEGAGRRADVDGLKALAILGVILVHMDFSSRLSAESLRSLHGLQVAFGWCVMAFFFSAGLLVKRGPGTPSELAGWIQGRAQRLLVPCVVFSVVYRLGFILTAQTGLFHWQPFIPRSFWDWVGFIFLPVGPQFYFLPFLFGISVACAGLVLLVKRIWLVWLGFTALHLLSGPLWETPERAHGPLVGLLPAYAYCYAQGLMAADPRFGSPLWLAVNAGLGLGAAVWWQNWFFVYPLVPWLVLRGLQQAGGLARLLQRSQLGERAGAVFVWHAPLVLPFCSLVAYHGLGGRFEPVEMLLTVALTLVCCYVMSEATRRVAWLRLFRF